ncbi:OmpA/MotB family protein [Carnobacterium inhibens]|uniref:Chemotaxis protein MotB n=1 Tax=Carnobacterium inhibens subsp. gilichinskyi TaxID=1266845 RepID=U5SEP2_9LACT|nr:flagellar motor protein MotB [Carnobacterium inhibens]AGY82337.1 chemotaxis protein MotB [Carnobacterium inhibens subsp. gilichinskyi]
MARRRKKKEIKNNSSSGGGWMTTFSDLMSLLLTFFILLYSMSSVSAEKFEAAAKSMQSAFGGGESMIEGSTVVDIETEKITETSEETIDPELVKMYNEVVAFLEMKEMTSQASVEYDQDGIYVNIQESILFGSGSAIIADSGKNTLNDLGELIQQFDNAVVIEGYTDNVPMNNNNFSSNWELSTGRALSVLRYLSEERNVDPTRLAAKGYGEYHPIVPNDSESNKAKNRRVNIVLVYDRQGG